MTSPIAASFMRAPGQVPPSRKAAIKDLSKAERRALQEAQRAVRAAAPAAGPSSVASAPPKSVAKPVEAAAPAVEAPNPLQLFLHLDSPSTTSSLSHSSKASTSNIHPSIIKLALQYAEFRIVGANARCIAMLEAFKDVGLPTSVDRADRAASSSRRTRLRPKRTSRAISPPIFPPKFRIWCGPGRSLYPWATRSATSSMRSRSSVWRWATTRYDLPTDTQSSPLPQAKALLIHKIDSFIRDRIVLADRVIEQHAIAKIKDGETILTYARSSVVEGVLLEAKRQGKVFSVIVVDSRPLYEGT